MNEPRSPDHELPDSSLPTEANSDELSTVDFDRSKRQPASTREIANYQIVRLLGSGHFGDVYLATRKTDEKQFAIKVLKLYGALTIDLKQRFLREATVLSQLQHPRIVRFHELGLTDDGFYLVMDYVANISWVDLKKRLPEKQQLRVAISIIDHCLEAVIFAHQRDIVHRDIKPSNLLLASEQKKLHVYLADFGLAKNFSQAGHSGMTSDHQIAGTFGYMAPELLNGVKFFKPASDQYAVASTLFCYLTGYPPIRTARGGNPLLELRRHSLPQMASVLPNIPSTLAQWLQRGLATNPADRFESAVAMRRSLQQVLGDLKA